MGIEIPGLPKIPTIRNVRGIRALGPSRITLRPEIGGETKSDKEILEGEAKQGVEGTLPERIIWRWLEREGFIFSTQSAELGGRTTVGGAVVDFVVYGYIAQPMIIRVMGGYWHGPAHSDRMQGDEEQKARLEGLGYHVVDLWEEDIYTAAKRQGLRDYIWKEV